MEILRRPTSIISAIAVFVILATDILIGPVVGQANNCPNGENYKPCTCSYYNGEYSVKCDQVLIEDVVGVFNCTTPSKLRTFNFSLSTNDASTELSITIPKDLLKEHQVHYQILINVPNRSYSLRVEPEAFRFSKNFTQQLYVQDCDISGLDFDFLMGFDMLSSLDIRYVSNVHLANWTSLPQLINLTALRIEGSTGLNEWEAFPFLIRGLVSLDLPSNDIQSLAMHRILNWTLSHSVDTMEDLRLPYNDLTSIPSQIPAFKILKSLYMDSQKKGIPLIPSGSIKLSGTVPISFSATNNRIETIEPGAFHGDFSGATVLLSHNNMQTTEAGVFQGKFNSARINLTNNKIQTIKAGTFQGDFSSASLYLNENQIETIGHGAFQGDFSYACINLFSNNIAKIEAGTFQGDFSGATVSLLSNIIQRLEAGGFQGDFRGFNLDLYSNIIQTIKAGAFQGYFSGSQLNLSSNIIETIEGGAFQGDFSYARVDLFSNNIAKIEAGTFKGDFSGAIVSLLSNIIQRLEAGGFQGDFSDSQLNLSSNIIETIEGGAFQGDFSNARVDLSSNNIAKIEAGTFKGDFSGATVSLLSNKLQTIGPKAFLGIFSHSTLSLLSNDIRKIETDAFLGDFSGSKLNLFGIHVETIDSGAFRGDFSGASVYLYNNSLTRFEELVFKDMLEQMANSSTSSFGFLDVKKNPFDCQSDPCHLAWLIRDNRRLLSHLDAYCSYGTDFDSLSPSSFDQCGITNSSVRPMAHDRLTQIVVASILILIWKTKFL